jgi:hypothetical protein
MAMAFLLWGIYTGARAFMPRRQLDSCEPLSLAISSVMGARWIILTRPYSTQLAALSPTCEGVAVVSIGLVSGRI